MEWTALGKRISPRKEVDERVHKRLRTQSNEFNRRRSRTTSTAVSAFSFHKHSRTETGASTLFNAHARALKACPLYIAHALRETKDRKALNSIIHSSGIKDAFILEEGHILVLHGTEAALEDALPHLSRKFAIGNTSDIDIAALKEVRGCRTPSPEPALAPSTPEDLYTYTLSIPPSFRGAVIGHAGANLRRLHWAVPLSSYPVVDHKSVLHLHGTRNQIEEAIKEVNQSMAHQLSPARLHGKLDEANLRLVQVDGQEKDWRSFMISLGKEAVFRFDNKDIAPVEWLKADFALAGLSLHLLRERNGELHLKGTENAARDLMDHLNEELEMMDCVSGLRLQEIEKAQFVTADNTVSATRMGSARHRTSSANSHSSSTRVPPEHQKRYKFKLPSSWSQTTNHFAFASIREQAKLRYMKIIIENETQHMLMLYGPEECIATAVRLLNDDLRKPFYDEQEYDQSKLQPDIYDEEDPECSWSWAFRA